MNRQRLFRKIVMILGPTLVNAAACAGPEGAPPEIERFTQQLTSEDAKVAEEARAKLEGMGAEVVPALFEKLPAADWTLKPRLLEVLSANGREFAKQKLLKGNESEKTYAALVYELTRAGQPDDHDTPEFKAMVGALLRAVKSQDKYLRAASGLALVHDVESTVWFEHFHEIIPALISSFDTDLVLRHRARTDPSDFVFVGICTRLDALIGDRPAYLDAQSALSSTTLNLMGREQPDVQRTMTGLMSARKNEIDSLRKYWTGWWDTHLSLAPVEIGKLLIERDIALLKEIENKAEQRNALVLGSMLRMWSGELFTTYDEADGWWSSNKRLYTGPPDQNNDD